MPFDAGTPGPQRHQLGATPDDDEGVDDEGVDDHGDGHSESESDSVAALFVALTRATRLRSLSLANNNLGPGSAGPIGTGLIEHYPAISELDLRGNRLGSLGLQRLTERLVRKGARGAAAAATAQASEITALELSGNAIDYTCAGDVVTLLRALPWLRRFSVCSRGGGGGDSDYGKSQAQREPNSVHLKNVQELINAVAQL